MFYLDDRMRQKHTHLPADTSSTGQLQQWHVPLKRVVQPKPLKEISFRKAEYGKPMTSSKSTAVTPSLSSLPKTPTADIEDLISEVQCSVSNSGISHFRVTPEI